MAAGTPQLHNHLSSNCDAMRFQDGANDTASYTTWLKTGSDAHGPGVTVGLKEGLRKHLSLDGCGLPDASTSPRSLRLMPQTQRTHPETTSTDTVRNDIQPTAINR